MTEFSWRKYNQEKYVLIKEKNSRLMKLVLKNTQIEILALKSHLVKKLLISKKSYQNTCLVQVILP